MVEEAKELVALQEKRAEGLRALAGPLKEFRKTFARALASSTEKLSISENSKQAKLQYAHMAEMSIQNIAQQHTMSVSSETLEKSLRCDKVECWS